MRWLYELFFLDKFTWSRFRFRFRKRQQLNLTRLIEGEILYRTELDYLTKCLSEQLGEQVRYWTESSGRVVCGTGNETIATLSLHEKGKAKSLIYIVIELHDRFEYFKAWFELAFLGFKLHFRRPTLKLKSAWSITPVPRRR